MDESLLLIERELAIKVERPKTKKGGQQIHLKNKGKRGKTKGVQCFSKAGGSKLG